MNQFELFVSGHYLTFWPDTWSFEKLIDYLQKDYELWADDLVIAWQPFEDFDGTRIANEMINMLHHLMCFFVEKK